MNKNIFDTLNFTHTDSGLKWHFLINISIDTWPFKQNEKKKSSMFRISYITLNQTVSADFSKYQ